ncbi:hypothetical protein [Parapedobacter composti]|nr:hypothetical protein [Parapedobacter composti]
MEKQNQSPNPFRFRITLLLLFMGSAGSALGQADVAVTQSCTPSWK